MVPANAIHPIHSYLAQLSCQHNRIFREAKLSRGIILLPQPRYSLCLHLGETSVLDEVDRTCLATAGSLPKRAISCHIKQHQTFPFSALYLPPFIPFYREWKVQPPLWSPSQPCNHPTHSSWILLTGFMPPLHTFFLASFLSVRSSSSALQDLHLQLSPDIHLILGSWHLKVLSS